MGCKVHSTPTHRRTNGVVQESTPDIADYETALDAAGYGKFSRSALSAAAFAFFSTGVQNCVMSYVLPAAKCELQLTTYQAGLVNMAFMCGGVASAFFWGIAGDVFGRRNVLSASLIIDAFITVAQSMATDYRVLLAVRSLNGFLIGCPSTLVLTYLSDLVGERRRQLYLTLTGMSFVAAWLILPAVAWLVIPLKTATPTILPIYSWRLYLALGSIPSLVAGVWMLFLPESPRLLADTDRSEQAVKILGRIHRLNCGSKEEYKVKKLIVENIFVAKNEDGEENRMKNLLIGVLQDLKTLLSKSYAVKSSLILFVFFGNMAAGFGLNNWIPELLIRMQGRSCEFASAAQTQVIASVVNSSIYNHLKPTFDYQTVEAGRENTTLYEQYSGRRSGDKVCNADMDDDVFTSGLIVGACCVLGNVACAILCSRGGARGVRYAAAGCALACTLACACLAAFACSCSASNQIAVAAAAALNAASLNGNVLLIRLLLHALPAKLSALGVCWGAWWGRAGGVASNFAVGVLLDYSCSAPFISVAAFLGVSVGAIMMIKIGDKEDPVVKDDQIEETNVEKNSTLGRYISTHM